jgi:chromosome segregation ATPase
MKVEYTEAELVEAKRQIDSTLHKLRETIKTFEAKENPHRYKSQITLAKRRIEAFEISVSLIEREITKLQEKTS